MNEKHWTLDEIEKRVDRVILARNAHADAMNRLKHGEKLPHGVFTEKVQAIQAFDEIQDIHGMIKAFCVQLRKERECVKKLENQIEILKR